ncbi:hypothetical protein ACWEOW_01040 [Monashia sp. NPDC004114]
MDIPVFVSCPTDLSPAQSESRKLVERQLRRYSLEPRALGRSDYPTEFPLREVLIIARHCAGGIILGFEQFLADDGTYKRETQDERRHGSKRPFPTPWNHLEAGILFGLRLPLLIFKEPGIDGGVFDAGVSDVFVHLMPQQSDTRSQERSLSDVFLKWQAAVRQYYYAT